MKTLFTKKKAMFFNISLVLITFGVLLTAYLVMSNTGFIENPVGKKQSEIFSVYQKGENILLYIDESARFASYETIFELAENGGFSKTSECGTYSSLEGQEFNLLNHKAFCQPDIEKSFEDIFNKKIKKYLSNLPKIGQIKNYDIEYSDIDYIISIIDNSIIGISSESIIIKNKNTEYAINPNFNIHLDYDFSDYSEYFIASKDISSDCSEYLKEDIEKFIACIEAKDSELREKGHHFRFYCLDPEKGQLSFEQKKELFLGTKEDNKMFFCINSEKEYPLFNLTSKTYELRPLNYRFAITLNKSYFSS